MKARKNVTQYAFNSDAFKERLKKARDDMHLKNSELAEKTGVSAATIGHYINGERTPRGFGDICPIAKALNVSLDYLAGMCDYNYLADGENSGTPYPQNYYDAVKLINVLTESFKEKTDLTSGNYNTVQIDIHDQKLLSFMGQQKQLYEMVGGSLSVRAFNIALDDLNDKMRKTPLEAPVRGFEDIDPSDIPF